MDTTNYPFRTTDKKLAFALALAGCQWAKFDQDGPATNTYSIGFVHQRRFENIIAQLRREASDGKVSIEQVGKELHRRKIPGVVEYCFVRDATFQEAIKAYDDLHAIEHNAKVAGVEMDLPPVSAHDVMTVFFAAARSEDEFAKIPFLNRMRQLVSTVTYADKDETAEVKDGFKAPVKKREGTGKVWSMFGSQQMKDDLHVS